MEEKNYFLMVVKFHWHFCCLAAESWVVRGEFESSSKGPAAHPSILQDCGYLVLFDEWRQVVEILDLEGLCASTYVVLNPNLPLGSI